ncbi:MAG: restriction endonuclease subunit S [Flavobacterium sp.]|nr:restriction endonuclease subunit S [Flavobacterium sp.]
MQQIFAQKLRFKDENGNNYPDWEEKKLGDLVDVVKGKQLNKEELSEVGTYPCQNGGIEPSGYTEEFNTIENTITISEGGNSCGYVNFMTSKFWCGGHCYSLLNIKNNVMKQFLFQYLKFNQNEIMKLRVGSGLPNIQKGSIANFRIEIPCLEEQQKIASFLSAIDIQIEGVSNKIEQTKLFKKGLLQQMFV